MRAWFQSRNRREQLLVTVFVEMVDAVAAKWLTRSAEEIPAPMKSD